MSSPSSAKVLKYCRECSAALSAEAPDGFCPSCMLEGALRLGASQEQRDGSTAPPTEQVQARFGDYELIEEIARGGMGVVYRARQGSLKRIVALKMILAGQFASKNEVLRFRAEAETAAKLHHPNIVAIHETGEHEGHHYFSMDFVQGRSLAEIIRDSGPIPAKRAAAYVQTIAQAIHYAHTEGVLHRDLKPSNVLIDANDQPRITDFGLAKRLRGDFGLTVTGQVLGSPNFMPPEQAAGSDGRGESYSEKSEIGNPKLEIEQILVTLGAAKVKVGPASDVYGIGAILYHLLTGRPPFQAATIQDVLVQLREAEPVAPRRLNPSVPPDLETICLKCLEKEPPRRYQTAQEAAEELNRFLNDEPIFARPVTRAERAWRWCRRKPVVASLTASSALLLLVVAIGAPILVIRTNRARFDAERNLYAADMKLASQGLREGRIDDTRDLLSRHRPSPGAADLRGFEWRYLWRATEQREVTQTPVGLSPVWGVDRVRLVRGRDTIYNIDYGRDELRAWNMANWTPLPARLPTQPAFVRWFWHLGQETALAVDNTNRTLTLYHLPDFQKGQFIPLRGLATQSAISPDRRLLAVCYQDGDDQRVSVWDLQKNSGQALLGEYSARVSQLEFSNDGKILAVACADGVIGLWDIMTSKPLPGPPKLEASKTFVQFAPSGSRFVYGSYANNALHLWDAVAGESSLVGSDLDLWGSHIFSPDGELLAAVGNDGGVRLFDVKSVRKVGTLRGHQGGVQALAFSPGGKFLATASYDRTARLWDLETERELATLGGHAGRVYGVAFSADGERLITISANGAAKVWDVREVLGRNLLLRNSTYNWQLRMSADGRLLATADQEGMIHIWDRLNGTRTDSIQTGSPGDFIGLAFEPQGHRLAWASWNSFGVLDLRSGRTNTIPIDGNRGMVEGISFSPVNQELVFSSSTNVMLCELPSMRLSLFARCEGDVYAIAYSPDGTLLAFGHQGGGVSLWDRRSGRKLFPPEGASPAHADLVPTVEFSRDGKWLASCGMLTINLWHVQHDGLTLSKVLRGHAGFVPAVAFSPDGTRLVSASSDCTLKLWDTEGIELGTLYGHRRWVLGVIFSKDGLRIYSTGSDGDVRVWEAPPLAEIDSPNKNTPSQSRTVRSNELK